MNVLSLRVDADPSIGTGHFHRVRAIAEEWIRREGTCVFLMRSGDEFVARSFGDQRVDVKRVRATSGTTADADETVGFVKQAGATWLVLDGYAFGVAYRQRVRATGVRLLWIDDGGATGPPEADLIVNPNVYANPGLYPKPAPARVLAGPRYATIRAELRNATYSKPDKAPNVLVTLGGSPPRDQLDRVVRGLDAAKAPFGIIVAPNQFNASAPVGPTCHPLQSLRRPTEWVGALEAASIAVSAAGTSALELAYARIPMILVAMSPNQEPVAEALESAGAAINLGRIEDLNDEALVGAVQGLMSDDGRRRSLARNASQLLDGLGSQRVVLHVIHRGLQLRNAGIEDAKAYWDWANDEAVRAASIETAPIPWDVHQRWFAARLADPQTQLLMGIDENGDPVGQVRFEETAEGAKVDVSVSPGHRGSGLGAVLLDLATRELFQRSRAQRAVAYVKTGNQPSIISFQRAGFTADLEPKTDSMLRFTLARPPGASTLPGAAPGAGAP